MLPPLLSWRRRSPRCCLPPTWRASITSRSTLPITAPSPLNWTRTLRPITVTNFVNLVNKGFYNGLTFHRIIDGFMIQGGCPLGNGTGNSGENIKGEFAQNGYNNPIAHERGVLSMARSSAPDSASCQFFIMHQAAPHLDGAYAAFGRVLSGIEVVDAICAGTPVTDSNGTVQSENQPVITSIAVIEKPAE